MRAVLKFWWRRVTGEEAASARREIESLRDCRTLLNDERHYNADERGRLNREIEGLRTLVRTMQAQTLATAQRVALADAYMADVPPNTAEVEWTKDDIAALAHFLEVTPSGKKLAQHLAARTADYDRFAIIAATSPNDAFARNKRAHGFRDCRGELLRLSAAGPSPAKHEPADFALPPELESLRA